MSSHETLKQAMDAALELVQDIPCFDEATFRSSFKMNPLDRAASPGQKVFPLGPGDSGMMCGADT